MDNKITESSIDSLTFDDKNFNKHNEYGMRLLESSIQKFGLGRSILIDKNNRIIAGNGVVETASQVGLDNVIIVETDGNQIVAVKRKDIDLNSAKGREFAMVDNATGKANLTWDTEAIDEACKEWDIEPEVWGVAIGDAEEDEPAGEEDKDKSYQLIVECAEYARLTLLSSELQDRGFVCDFKC